MGRVKQQDADDLIPIGVSVKLLDEQYPHLRHIKWNDSSDEEEKEVKRKRKDKNGI